MSVETTRGPELVDLLESIYQEAEAVTPPYSPPLSGPAKAHLDRLSEKSPHAKQGFVNIVTCLACKALDPSVDCRYHRREIGSPNYFTGRTLSEDYIGPWLRSKDFVWATSGWQTRTFERPKPYTLDYDENIRYIKDAFLGILDEVQEKSQSASEAIKYLFVRQIELREHQSITIARPSIDRIELICRYFQEHYSHQYDGSGASRLPVLMVYATYQAMMGQLNRYGDKVLLPLQAHSAADLRTGAIGDIEIADNQGQKFEGVEIKHGIPISPIDIQDAYEKFKGHPVRRYYLLTTADPHLTDPDETNRLTAEMYLTLGCQVIVNGVLPTIRYYLRLLESPDEVFGFYAELLTADTDVGYEQKAAWNDIVAGRTEP